MKTTIIELLNKIANGEEVPKKILYKDEIFEYNNNDYESIHSSVSLLNYFGDDYIRAELLDEVEILETTIKYKTYHNDILHFTEIEKTNDKIEKIDITDKSICVKGTRFFRDKDIEIFQKLSMVINEIIDHIN